MSAVLETVILPLNYLDMAPVVGLEPTLQVSKTRALTFELYGNMYDPIITKKDPSQNGKGQICLYNSFSAL